MSMNSVNLIGRLGTDPERAIHARAGQRNKAQRLVIAS